LKNHGSIEAIGSLSVIIGLLSVSMIEKSWLH